MTVVVMLDHIPRNSVDSKLVPPVPGESKTSRKPNFFLTDNIVILVVLFGTEPGLPARLTWLCRIPLTRM